MSLQTIKNAMRPKYAVFIALLLSLAPVTQAQAREIDLEKLRTPQNGQGVVLVSLTVSGLESQLYASFAYHEPQDASSKPSQIVVGRPLFSSNESFSAVDGRWGRLVALQLHPGKYQFGESSAWVMQGQSGAVRTMGSLNRQFEVLPNKVVYLGNLDIFPRWEPSFKAGHLLASIVLGLTGGPIVASGNGASVVYDELARDLKFLKTVNPTFDATQIISKPMVEDRDERMTAFAKMIEERASNGDLTAKALISQARVIGAAELPDYRVLRLPAQGNFDPTNFDHFLNVAGPKTLFQYMAMNATPSMPVGRVPLSPEAVASMAQRSASAYQSNAVQALAFNLRRANQDAESKAWDIRLRRVGYKLNSSEAQVASLAGLQIFQHYEQLQAERKVLFVSLDGQAHVAQDDGKAPMEQFLVQAAQACEQKAGSSCAIQMLNRTNLSQSQGSCSILHLSQGIANQFPPTNYASSPESGDVSTAWAKSFSQWVEIAQSHQAYPRSFVWDNSLKKGFGAYGDCSSALRAVSACKKEGGAACELVVQDDKQVEATDYAKDMMARIKAYELKRTLAGQPTVKVTESTSR
jgi:hypothetical protein